MPGRLLVFLHRAEEGGASQLLAGLEGWNVLSETTVSQSEIKPVELHGTDGGPSLVD